MSRLVELILLVVATACAAEGRAAWDMHDRMSALGFWTAGTMAVMLGLGMAASRWERRP